MDHLQAERIAEGDLVIRSCGRESEDRVKIKLLVWRKLVCHACVDDVLRASALGERARIFDVGIPGWGELAIEVHAGLSGPIAPARLRGPRYREHACDGPVLA